MIGAPALDTDSVILVNEYRAQQAKAAHDYEEAIRYSAIARDAALGQDDKWAFFRSSFNIAHYEYALGRMDDCIRTVEALVGHPTITEYPELIAQGRILLAHALQDSGASERAFVAVEQASSVITDKSGQLRLKAQFSVVSTLAEKGEVEAAWREAVILDDLIGPESAAKVRGMAYWTIGNAGFMSGRVEEGKQYHLRAATALAAVGDVNLWALFNKAAANMRIEAGILDEETAEYLERAEVAISVSEGSPVEKLEILLARAHWEYATGDPGVAERSLRNVAEKARGTFPYIHAQAYQLLASCLLQLGRTEEAKRIALETEQMLEESGATERLSQMRKVLDSILQDRK